MIFAILFGDYKVDLYHWYKPDVFTRIYYCLDSLDNLIFYPVEGDGNSMETAKSSKLVLSPPKPNTIHIYKTLCLNIQVVLGQKRSCQSNITFCTL